LVDRLWPREVKKEEARIDLWFKEIAPSLSTSSLFPFSSSSAIRALLRQQKNSKKRAGWI
jgi:hypothetical protein